MRLGPGLLVLLENIMVCTGIWSAVGMIYFFFTPRRYSVSLKGIVINRPIRRVVIPFSEIRKVTLVNHVPLWWHFGLIGPADPFLGPVNFYVSRCTELVRVDAVKRVCYLSPRDPAALVEAVKQRLEQLPRCGGTGGGWKRIRRLRGCR
ncbi:MAG: PH domain-containing protein [Firmicutes bacterium]|nr:PH domain-containing protein [Bacillota bacterium]